MGGIFSSKRHKNRRQRRDNQIRPPPGSNLPSFPGHGNGNASRNTQRNVGYGSSSHRNRSSTMKNQRTQGETRAGRVHSYGEDEERMVVMTLHNDQNIQKASIKFKNLELEKTQGMSFFGEVIEGKYLGGPVLIKRMLRNQITESNLRTFCDEINLMLELRHPNIIQFIGASWDSFSNICYVTERLAKGTLRSVLDNADENLAWNTNLLNMTLDIARGMAYLHRTEQPILHRNLRSSTVHVNAQFLCKISDFANCRVLSAEETMTVTGCPMWMAPEMIRNESYDQKVDVYSFGIMLSELDTRKLPYHDFKKAGGKPIGGTVLMHKVSFMPEFRPTLTENISPTLRELYLQCVHDKAEERPDFVDIINTLDVKIRKELKNMNKISKSAASAKVPQPNSQPNGTAITA